MLYSKIACYAILSKEKRFALEGYMRHYKKGRRDAKR